MVMSVFTLPSYDVVFKVIKDEFTPPKEVSHEQVKEKYRLVKQHDRVGRMADTQEFTNFEFPLDRISPDLLAELKAVAPSALTLTADKLVIKHLYTERKMIPEPLSGSGGRTADPPRPGGVRQRHPPARGGQHLPRRHAVQELRGDSPRPGGLL